MLIDVLSSSAIKAQARESDSERQTSYVCIPCEHIDLPAG
jgi:hypothetical protein